MAIVVLNFN